MYIVHVSCLQKASSVDTCRAVFMILNMLVSCNSFTEKMVQMGYNYQEIQESLNENKFDEICATYMLLGLQKDQQILSNPSSSSLSPMGLEHTISLTPSSIPPLSPSTRGDVASGYGRPPPPSPTTKTSSAGTPSAVMQKKMSAPGVVSSSVSNRACNCHNGTYMYCNYLSVTYIVN